MYSANLIGKQMDTEFGLYLPEYSIPAPEVQTNYKEIPFRDGAIDKTSPDGVVHYKDREWDLTFKKTGATVSASDLAALAMSVMNAIHGKAGEIIFDDDPNYKWVGRVFVTSVDCENNGLLIVNIHMITHPYKYSLADIVVVDEIQTTSDEYEGSIVSLIGGIGKSITELLVSFSPIQDLHGYANPWPGGGGKNLADVRADNATSFQKISVSGDEGYLTFETTGDYGRAGYTIPVVTGQTYTISFKASKTVSSNTNSTVYVNDTVGNWNYSYGTFPISKDVSDEREYTKTITATSDTLFLGFYISAGGSHPDTVIVKDLQVELGSSKTSYSPYSNICPISGRTGLSVYRTGKNLQSPHLYTGMAYNPTVGSTVTFADSSEQFTDNGDGTFTIQTSSTWRGYTIITPVTPGETYHQKFKFESTSTGGTTRATLDKDFKILSTINSTDAVQNINANYTAPEDAAYWCVLFTNRGTASTTLTLTQPQFEIGSVATDYEPYTGNTYAIDWTSQAGTVYHGTVDPVSGQLTVDAMLEVFNVADENLIMSQINSFNKTSGSVGTIGDYTRISFAVRNDVDQTQYNRISSGYNYKISNMLKHYFAYNDQSSHWYRNTILYAFFPTSLVGSTAQSVYDYLVSIKDTTPLSVWLELATPITYQLTTQEIEALVGTNNIWSTGDSISVTISTMDKVTLVNHGKPMNPKINVVSEGSISLLFEIDGVRYTAALSAGEYVLPDLVLFDGSTDVYEAGEGTITYTYPEVSL